MHPICLNKYLRNDSCNKNLKFDNRKFENSNNGILDLAEGIDFNVTCKIIEIICGVQVYNDRVTQTVNSDTGVLVSVTPEQHRPCFVTFHTAHGMKINLPHKI